MTFLPPYAPRRKANGDQRDRILILTRSEVHIHRIVPDTLLDAATRLALVDLQIELHRGSFGGPG